MRSIKNLEVTMNSSNRYLSTPIFEVKQEDDVTVELIVVNDEGPINISDQTAVAYFKLPNGVSYDYKDCVVNETSVELVLTSAYTSIPGKVTFELELTDSNGVTTTQTYFYLVNGRVKSETTISPNTYDNVVTMTDKANQCIEELAQKLLEATQATNNLSDQVSEASKTESVIVTTLS